MFRFSCPAASLSFVCGFVFFPLYFILKVFVILVIFFIPFLLYVMSVCPIHYISLVFLLAIVLCRVWVSELPQFLRVSMRVERASWGSVGDRASDGAGWAVRKDCSPNRLWGILPCRTGDQFCGKTSHRTDFCGKKMCDEPITCRTIDSRPTSCVATVFPARPTRPEINFAFGQLCVDPVFH